MELSKEVSEIRKTEYPINNLLLNRWSPRSFSKEEVTTQELMSLFEAAKWAPSSFNSQPWRFIYARNHTSHWETFLNLLMEGNKTWAKNAAALVLIISRKNFEHNEKFSRTHSFSTGSAFQNLCIEATSRNLAVHGMGGFDYDKAKTDIAIPDNYEILAMAAIGKPGKKEDLEEDLREIEKPSLRKKTNEIVMEGKFH